MFTLPRTFATQAYQPLIRFIGRRQWPSVTDTPHAHPAAPTEFREQFADFLKKRQTAPSITAAAGSVTYNNFWEMPSRYWRPRVRELEETEMEAIMSGGASSYHRN